MASYRLSFRESVLKDLRALPKADVKRILRRIDSLAQDPRGPGCEKLAGVDYHRVRQGRHRILYEIHDDVLVVVVIKVAHRRDVYRGI